MAEPADHAAAPRRARRRSRPSHAIRNDALMQARALEVLSAIGWDALSINRVAKASGLTSGPVLNRYPDKGALALDLWQREGLPALTDALEACLTAALSPEPSARSEAVFTEAMRRFVQPSMQISAGVELALGCRFDPVLGPQVTDALSAWLADRCLPDRHGREETGASQAAAIIVWAMGLVMFANRPWIDEMDITPALSRAFQALQRPAPIRPVPVRDAAYLRASPFDTGDPRLDEIMDAVLETVARVGYQRTRLRDVAQAGGMSEGFLFSRFPTKLDLFLAVTESYYAQAYQDSLAYQQAVADEHGQAIAEAAMWREYLNPAIADRQSLGVETDRLSRYDQRMQDFTFDQDSTVLQAQLAGTDPMHRPRQIGYVHLDFATGHGLAIVGLLLPKAWDLPFNVVTEPYLQALPEGPP
ncbi:MAG: TetR/AcrR family transcriptional regulator [Actinomycetales bacterium]|nr:TetR/AcrR family transcriptional regulator [Actinomycetales bacterium]